MSGTSRTDRELLDEHVAGDTEAFGELYERHHDRLRSVARGIVGQDAEDALQDGMISAYRKADQFHGDSAVRTWLHRIVVNACIDQVRRRPLVAEEYAEASHAPWRIRQASQRMDIDRNWHVLTEGQKQCLVLVHMLGYPLHEAAKILGVSEGTLKSRCSRGCARLSHKLYAYDPRTA